MLVSEEQEVWCCNDFLLFEGIVVKYINKCVLILKLRPSLLNKQSSNPLLTGRLDCTRNATPMK